jgi:hypothetical protein
MNQLNKLVLHNTELEMIVRDKYSSLLGKILRYEDNEVLWIRPLDLLMISLISSCLSNNLYFFN